MALRGARLLNKDVLVTAGKLVNDSSAQVRREVAISIRGDNSIEAADLWTKLAQQYDGKDRWYLEALGISRKETGIFTSANGERVWAAHGTRRPGRDIVWRSRSRAAMPLLADLIKNVE